MDVQAIAGVLGISRATVYRWFSSREGLLGEVLAGEFAALLHAAEGKSARRGPARVAEILDSVNRQLVRNRPFRQLFEQEQATVLRLLTNSAGPVQPKIIEVITDLLERATAEDDWTPQVDIPTLAYALTRLSEAFLYNDVAAGIRGDVDRLHAVQVALLRQ